VRDLRGKKIAATRGTDPWFFLLRSLQREGLATGDVELVDLQHPDGRVALERGQVDAWAGLDPHMAASQLEAGSRLLYRNVAFNTWGALNAREDFLAAHPDVVQIVLHAYDRARKYAAAHVDETAALLADASHVERRVADLQLRERTTYPGDGTPGNDYHDAIAAVVPLIRSDKLAKPDADLDVALGSLIDSRRRDRAAWVGSSLPLALFAAWWAATASGAIKSYQLASPRDVVRELFELAQTGLLWRDLGASIERVALGFAIALFWR
jgi:sulfonate transport system substrate-binding protein